MARFSALVLVVLGVVLLCNPLYTLGWNDRYVHEATPAVSDDAAVIAYEDLDAGSRTVVRQAISEGRHVVTGIRPDTRFSYPPSANATYAVSYAGTTYRLRTAAAPGDPLVGVLVMLAVALFGLGALVVGVRGRFGDEPDATVLLVVVVAAAVLALGPLARYPVGVAGWRSLAVLSPLVPLVAVVPGLLRGAGG